MKSLTEALALIGITALMFVAVGLYHDVQILTPEDLQEICRDQAPVAEPTEEDISRYLDDQEGFYYPVDEVIGDSYDDESVLDL